MQIANGWTQYSINVYVIVQFPRPFNMKSNIQNWNQFMPKTLSINYIDIMKTWLHIVQIDRPTELSIFGRLSF